MLGDVSAADGEVFCPGAVHSLVALDSRTGRITWTFDAFGPSGVASAPAVADGVVYVTTIYRDDPIPGIQCRYALNARTGRQVWSSGVGFLEGSLAVGHGVVYQAAVSGLTARDANDGAVLWQTLFGDDFDDHSSPAVANGLLYLGSWKGVVRAFDLATGARLWNYRTDGADGFSPAVVNGMLYIGSQAGNFYAFGLPKTASTLRSGSSGRPMASRDEFRYGTGILSCVTPSVLCI